MSNILPFKKKKPDKGNIMCVNNHHKWAIVKEQQFDVKLGKLVTVERCSRCKKTRNRLS
jgi:co-chaperonin GroES (HSP10)